MLGLAMKIVVVAALGIGAVTAAYALAAPKPGHAPFHIGCKHHNHGPAWHADHGRILGAAGSGDDLSSRSLTAGRSRGTRVAY